MSLDPSLPTSIERIATTYISYIGSVSAAPGIDVEEIYERHAREQYRDHERNIMMKAALGVIEKQKEFRGVAAEDFARVF